LSPHRHVDHAKGPPDLKEISPKMASDIACRSKQFGVSGDALHEAIPPSSSRSAFAEIDVESRLQVVDSEYLRITHFE